MLTLKKLISFIGKNLSGIEIKPIHPGEKDESLPIEIRGKHFDSWTELAGYLGYGEEC